MFNPAKSIRTFFGSEPVHVKPSIPTSASLLSVDIVNYAMSLVSRPEAVAPQRRRLAQLLKNNPEDAVLAKLYLEVEDYLVNSDPVRKFQSSDLRRRIWERYSLIHSTDGLALMFAPPQIQEVRLAALVLRQILQHEGRLLGTQQLESIAHETTEGGPLAGLEMTRDGINFPHADILLERLNPTEFNSVFFDLANLFTVLLVRLKNIAGSEVATNFETAYKDVKSRYGSFIPDFSRVATLLPEGVLEEEKLQFLSRDTLEQKIREKTRQLQAEKDSVERQVTERTRQLAEEQAKLTASIDSLSQGLLMVDAAGHIIIKNQAASKVLGYTSRTWSLDNVVQDMGQSVKLLESIKGVQNEGLPLILPDVKFKARILRLSLTPVLTGKRIIGVVILIEDVTEARVLERSRDEFFSIASHELRTPLTAIRGNSQMMIDYFPGSFKDPQLREMMDDVHDSSVRLIEIVNDFLDASRLEQGRMKFTFTKFDVADVLEKVTYELAGVSRDKGIYLRLDPAIKSKQLPEVYADVDRVKQVVYNLVGNAMKFVLKGGVTIGATVQADHLTIAVTDTGPGIDPENQKLLFHKFQQAGKSIVTRDTTRGTGLGLYISRLLLEHMDGEIMLETSQTGKGSTFSFTIPLAEHKAKAKRTPAQP